MKKPHSASKQLALSAAATAAATLAPAAYAAPVIVNPVTVPTVAGDSQVTGFSSRSFDLDGNGADDFVIRLQNQVQYFGGPYTSGIRNGAASLLPAGANNAVQLGFAPGANLPVFRSSQGISFTVGPNNEFVGGGQLLRFKQIFYSYSAPAAGPTGLGSWGHFVDTGYAGVKFYDGFNLHFGWIKLRVTSSGLGIPLEIEALQWAYESIPEQALHVTSFAVPEVPASAAGLGALALGALGVQRLRRNRKTAATPATAAN